MTDLRTAIRDREPVAGTWVSVGHPAVAETSAGQGFDFVAVDTEHAPTSVETLPNLLRAVEAAPGDAATVVRVAWNDPVRIKRVLDAGPDGLMAPMIESADDARALVEAARYPPEGRRGLAASRASDYGRNLDEYVATANERILVVAQVESARGVENARGIAAVDGIDALLVGPADLSASLGAFGEYDGEAFGDAVDASLDAAHAESVAVGTLATTPARIDDFVARGFDFLVAGHDVGYLADGETAARERYEKAVEENRQETE